MASEAPLTPFLKLELQRAFLPPFEQVPMIQEMSILLATEVTSPFGELRFQARFVPPVIALP